MKKIYIYLLVIMIITACSEDFITKSDPDNITDNLVLTDIDQIAVAMNGVYDGMQTANYYGRYYVLIPDLMGDDVKQSQENSNRGTTNYRYEVSTNDGIALGVWQDIWNVVNRANVIIKALPDIEGEATIKNQIMGEALAARALGHFDLVRYFALPYTASSGAPGANGAGGHLGIPVVTEPQLPDSKLPRNTVSEVYTQVIADLTQAVGLMDDASNFSQVRLTSAGAQALLARVYLYQEEWEKAEAMATSVIGNDNYSLLTAANYVGSWDGNTTSSESIFEIAFNPTDFNGTNQLGYMYSPTGYYDMLPTTDLDDVVADISDPVNDVRTNLWDTSVPVATKYKGPDNIAGAEPTIVIRLSEMYLIRAEARAQQSNFSGARSDLNMIRTNRGITATTSADPDLLYAIAQERRLEFAFEGHRLFDITRRGENLNRTDCALVNGNCNVNFPDFRFAAPIPQNEIDVNQNMQQNPGY